MQKVPLLKKERGSTMVNLVITMGIVAILMGVAALNLRVVQTPLEDSSFTLNHFLRLARSKAISQTQFIILEPSTPNLVQGSSSDSCDGTLTAESSLNMALEGGGKHG